MKDDFTLEDILEEQRQQREAAQKHQLPQGAEYVEEPLEEYAQPEEPFAQEYREEPAQASQPEDPPVYTEAPEPEPEPSPEEHRGKKKKKRWGFFGRKKRVPDFDENEDDMYYGIQLKPIDEYRLDCDAPPLGEEGYKALFDDSKAIDDEVEENFQRLQRERRRRVAEAVQSAGMDEQQVADEFGVAAPMPVTPFAADPYARQHGLEVEGMGDPALTDLQKAMLETSGDQTMEIKLNVLNSTIELQKLQDGQPVSEETVDRILASAPQGPEPPLYEEAARPAGYSNVGYEQEAYPQVSADSPEYVEAPTEQPEPIYEYVGEAPTLQPEGPVEFSQRPVYQEEPGQGYQETPRREYPESVHQETSGQKYQEPAYQETPRREYQEPVYQETSGQEYQEPAYQGMPGQDYPEPVYQEEPVYPDARPHPEKPSPLPPAAEYTEPEPPSVREPALEQPPAGYEPLQKLPVPEQGKTIEMPAARPAASAVPQAPTQPAPEQAPPPRPIQQIPYVENIYEYRSRSIPTHIINADVLQSALLSESESLQRAIDAREAKQAPHKRVKARKPEERPEEKQPPKEESKEAIEDYTGPEDARSISNELRGEMHELSMRLMITGVCTVLLALTSVLCRSNFSPKGSGSWPLAYVILTLVFTIVAIGVCHKTMLNGLKGLFSARANSDSAVAVAVVVALVQTMSGMFFRSQLVEGGLHLYAPVATALLFVNAIGKLTMKRRIHSNFRFVTSREQKYGVKLFDDYNTSLKMTKDCVAEKPLIAYQCRAGFLKRFLELSHLPDPSESSSQLLAPLGLISSLVLCIACLLITRDVPMSIGALTAACCACVAAGNMLCINLPVSRMCKMIRRAGGMAVGYEAVESLGDVNAVIADAGELFPTGTVVLKGIKVFGSKVMAEDAIMAATALMKEIGGPLSGVFDQVISENEEILPEVEKYGYESGGGVVGRVDGRTVYIGNRGLLINHRLEAPAREEETQYSSGNKNVIYIALDAEVAALLVLEYSADRRRKNELQRLEDSGISVLVRTTDPNVNVALVSRLFGIDSASIGILDGQLGDAAQQLIQAEPPRVDAVAATKGRMESMMSLVSACVEQKRMTGMLVAIQTVSVVLTFVLVALFACFGRIGMVSSLVLFGIELFWVLLLAVLPKLRR